MFAVGITDQVDIAEVASFASTPEVEGTNYWFIDDFTDLAANSRYFAEGLCSYEPVSTVTPGVVEGNLNYNQLIMN